MTQTLGCGCIRPTLVELMGSRFHQQVFSTDDARYWLNAIAQEIEAGNVDVLLTDQDGLTFDAGDYLAYWLRQEAGK